MHRISSSSPITQILLVSLALAILALVIQPSEARSVALPSPQCHPAVVNTMKPRIRQICKALEAIWEFSDVMENYLDEKENDEISEDRDDYRPVNPKYVHNLSIPGVKRKAEDVDHVFLRFGKRSGLY
ncbi:hypothetical protein TCAL_05039 [Tigriopus californicus]|uniref:Myosuppressin n=1 Tax=Tigriopus californicus TaxID=6832 RepID=A0A553P7B6_TIGCA|nr:myosuppressin-like [Tigriopus californicus]TRY73582.1 hypothetical protein TCAL_05039 [Tigriopus californicus]|eukprot:TCALIF_05039-PA protein Name:"Similar to Myosuppressin (Apis mellifera)" AED:0.01 eAED:0.01 QI:201/1/1/1/1/1/4/1087/127